MLQHPLPPPQRSPSSSLHQRTSSFSTSNAKGSPGRLQKAKTLKRTSILSVKHKSIWPELVGLSGVEAKRRIREEIPSVQAPIISRNALITEEYIPGRVQIFVNDENIVIWPPQIG
eukprot:scaffold1919_cov69-Cylindrotheca_fusiformis.AAC.1